MFLCVYVCFSSVASVTDACENCTPDMCTFFVTLHTCVPYFRHTFRNTQSTNPFIKDSRLFFSISKRRYSTNNHG